MQILCNISIICVIAGIFYLILNFAFLRKDRAEARIEKSVIENAIKGNKIAIYLHRKRSVYREKEGDLIKEAMEGNAAAIKALGIDKRDLERMEAE